MNNTLTPTLIALTFLVFGCQEQPRETTYSESEPQVEPTNRVVLSSEIEWEALNPARGDASPKAGTVFGDRKGEVPTGFLAKFVDGFSSPPHIHNVTYRALVVSGLIHNDDENAEKMWMPPGSFWTQPAGEAHITSAKGENCIAYVEIDQGPYLVMHIDEAFDNGERPVNVDKSNLVWLDNTQTNLMGESGAEIAFLWDNGNLNGRLLKLPTDEKINLISEGDIFHAVVITGNVKYTMPSSEVMSLDAGSYFTSTDYASHVLAKAGTEETLVYIRTNGPFSILAQ